MELEHKGVEEQPKDWEDFKEACSNEELNAIRSSLFFYFSRLISTGLER